MKQYIEILTTTPDKKEAHKISEQIINERLAGCVQISAVESIYRWKGAVQKENEYLCRIKTVQANYGRIESLIKKIHSYEVPEIVSVPVLSGSNEYLEWLDSTVEQ